MEFGASDHSPISGAHSWPHRSSDRSTLAAPGPTFVAAMTAFPTSLAETLADRYRIEREIGAGGMATVYLARDLRHNRNVALKVLKPDLGAVLGVDRFLAEIQVTANLQHPHLLPLFDSGEAGGLLFYVMPYVEGESLRGRLDREKQLPVDEAIRISCAVASALDYAHRHNVVHRDLKPENILLLDGQPVVADLGIALAVTNAGGERITQTGLSLGTPQYMSPEQATGDRTVDGRSDIYSLAALTYEMLAGEAPHLGNTVQAIIAKVLTERPVTVQARRPSVPAHVALALDKALEKTPADRFTRAAEFADALQPRTTGAVTHGTVAAATQPARTRAPGRELAAWTLAGVAMLAAAGIALRPRVRAEATIIRAHLDLPPNIRINDALAGTTIAVSPDGKTMAFTGIGPAGFLMFIRHVNELEARPIADANIAGRNVTFSPDGSWIAFTEGNVLKKISVNGGQVTTLAASLGTVSPYGLAWTESDTIIIGSFVGLHSVGANGGASRPVPRTDSADVAIGQRWPVMVPGTDAIIYQTGNQASTSGGLAALSTRTGRTTPIDIVGATPLGFQHGHLVYITPIGDLMAVPFDTKRLRPSGDPIRMGDGVVIDPTAGAKASLSRSGTLVYLRGRPEYQPVLVEIGSGQSLPIVRELQQYATPRFSPDGARVAITVFGTNSVDIWVHDIRLNTARRITTDGTNMRPEWTPNGSHLVFRSERQGKVGIWWQPADGRGAAELLYEPDFEIYEAVVSPDSKWLVVRTGPGSAYSRDILLVPMTGEKQITPFITGPFSELMPRISPDGQWLAYVSNESGRFEVYVRPFPENGAPLQVSDAGGSEPIWGKHGRSLYYRRPAGDVAVAEVTTGASFSIGQRRVAVTGEYLTDSSHPNYDVAPDGRLLMLKRAGAESRTVVVHNWGRELREVTGGGQ